jgi:hypothetical protein
METFEITLHEKVTVWMRAVASIEANDKNEAIEKVMLRSLKSGNIGDLVFDLEADRDTLYDSEEQLLPEENGNMPTVELSINCYDCEIIELWNNLPKNEENL